MLAPTLQQLSINLNISLLLRLILLYPLLSRILLSRYQLFKILYFIIELSPLNFTLFLYTFFSKFELVTLFFRVLQTSVIFVIVLGEALTFFD